MRVGAGGQQRWQETGKQNEKHQLQEAYTLRADARHASRLTPEPAALSVAGPFAFFVASPVFRPKFPLSFARLRATLYDDRPILRRCFCTRFFSSFTLYTRLNIQTEIVRGFTMARNHVLFMCYRADEVSTSEVVQQKLSQSASDTHAELPSPAASPSTRHGHGRREEEAFRALNPRVLSSSFSFSFLLLT